MNAFFLRELHPQFLFCFPSSFLPLTSPHLPECPARAQAKRTGLLFLTLSSQFIKHRLRRKTLYPRRM